MQYPPTIEFFILKGVILRDPPEWTDEFIGSVNHCKDLFTRLGVDASFTETEDGEGSEIHFADKTAAYKQLLNAQMNGTNDKGDKLYAGDFPLLGQLTGRSV